VNPLVVGIGATARGDDAIGVEVARAVDALQLTGVDVVEAAEPVQLLDLVEGRPTVIIVDAMLTGAAPGAVAIVDHLPAPDRRPSSTHGLGVGQALALARILDRLPHRLFIVGVEITDALLGSGLSGPVQAAVPRAADEIRRLLSDS
jgi:hydrogenase maturation protease